jgi:hypothetical protein
VGPLRPRALALFALLAAWSFGCRREAIVIAGLPPSAPPPDSALFDFDVNFWVNLHHRLYEGSGRGGPSTPDKTPYAPAERKAWDEALAYYGNKFTDRGFASLFSDPRLTPIARALARLEAGASTASSGLEPTLIDTLEGGGPDLSRPRLERGRQNR